jgi:hypothetical protein
MSTAVGKGVKSQPVAKGRHVGKVNALSTLSPVRWDKRFWLDWRLLLVSRLVPALGRPLAQLSFIHYARWMVLKALPEPDGKGGRFRPNSSYLLFESNYNGRPGDYLDAFAFALPHRLARLWGTCVDFEQSVENAPGAGDRVVAPWAFREYVRRNELDVLHFYAAYPDDTVVTVRQAIAVAGRCERARLGGTRGLEKAAADIVPLVLGPTRERLGPLAQFLRFVHAQGRAITRRYGVNPLTVILPILPNRCDTLAKYLRKLPQRGGPLSRVEGTHFARFVLLGPQLTDLGQAAPDHLDVPYLLFTSNYCGSAEQYLKALCDGMGPDADQIWGECAGYPGVKEPRRFEDWFRRHSFTTQYFVAGYPPRSVPEVCRSVRLRDALAADLGHSEPGADWLRAAIQQPPTQDAPNAPAR